MSQKDLPPQVKSAPQAHRFPAADEQLVAQVRHEFSGPLPPPDLLAQYDQVMPGLAQKIVSQFESETNHRHQGLGG